MANKTGPGNPGDTWLFGKHVVNALLTAQPQRIIRLCCAAGKEQALWQQQAAAKHVPIQVVQAGWLQSTLGEVNHQGIAAQCHPFPYCPWETLLAEQTAQQPASACLLALDQVQDANNVGSMARTALALGASGMLLPKDRACLITPQVEKVAAGALCVLPVVQVVNLTRSLQQAHQAGFWCIGLDMAADAQPLAHCRFDVPVIFVLGAEGKGLRPLVRSACQVVAQIPMVGPMESLNVAVSAGIALYERLRQRSS